MKIKTIEIANFRNIESLNLDFEDVNIIYGENAQGKTNLIEAIYLFTGAKSFRGVKDRDVIRFGCDLAKLNIAFENNNREQTAQLIIKNKREAELNGIKKTSVSVLSDEIKAVIFSPAHLSMIKDGPAERRRFIDSALFQIKAPYKSLLKEYNRCLDQRNMLLKDMSKHAELEKMLYIWDRNLAHAGAKIINQRKKYIDALLPFAEEVYDGLSSGREKISLSISGAFEYNELQSEEIENELIALLEKNREKDKINRMTTAGVHRDDVLILINGKSARTYGSQGQQRSCVLALKLAEAALLKKMTGNEPIALLDDVMSELDEYRQDYILNQMKDRQCFITCCDANTILRLKKGKTFHIKNGGLI